MVRNERFVRRPVWLGGLAMVAGALLVGMVAHRSIQAQGAGLVAATGPTAEATREVGLPVNAGVTPHAAADPFAEAGRAKADAAAARQAVDAPRDDQSGVPDADEIRRYAREAAEQARHAATQAREAVRLALQDMDMDALAAEARATAAQWVGPPRLGVSVRDVTDDEARAANLEAIAGARVTSVADGSAAAEAGLAEGDVIVRADGETVRSARHLTRLVAETPAGRPLTLVYVRDGRQADVTVTLASRTPSDFTFPRAFPEGFPFERGRSGAMMQRGGRLGVSVQPLTPQLASHFGVTDGVLVTEVRDGTPAARGGVKAGDVITKVGEQAVARPADVTRAVAAAASGSSLALHVMRDRQPMTLEVTLDTRPSRLRTTTSMRPRIAA